MAGDARLVDAGKLDLTALEIDDPLSIPATKPQQKIHKVNNLHRMATVECCTLSTLVPPSDAVKVLLAFFVFIYSRGSGLNVAS